MGTISQWGPHPLSIPICTPFAREDSIPSLLGMDAVRRSSWLSSRSVTSQLAETSIYIYICFKWHVFPRLEHCLRLFNLVSQMFHRVNSTVESMKNSPKKQPPHKTPCKGRSTFCILSQMYLADMMWTNWTEGVFYMYEGMEVLPHFFQVPPYPALLKVNTTRIYRKLIRLLNGCMITSLSSDGLEAEDWGVLLQNPSCPTISFRVDVELPMSEVQHAV